MPHSHHSHSGQFCRHAKDNLEDVILEAIRQGFQSFGLSEHAPRWRLEDLFPEEVSSLGSVLGGINRGLTCLAYRPIYAPLTSSRLMKTF